MQRPHSPKVPSDRIAGRLPFALASVFLIGFAHLKAGDLTQSPFDYSLAGVARFEGVSYAILIDRQTNEHVLLTSDKSEHGLRLESVTPDNDRSGSSAIIQKNGESIYLSLDSRGVTTISQLGNVPMPGSLPANGAGLKPPAGASLPLVFQPVDAKALQLTDEQKATISLLRQDFLKAVNDPNAVEDNSTTNSPQQNNQNTTTDPQQLQKWETAQEKSDEQFKLQFGWDAFNRYQMALKS